MAINCLETIASQMPRASCHACGRYFESPMFVGCCRGFNLFVPARIFAALCSLCLLFHPLYTLLNILFSALLAVTTAI